jgi:hypothetical protein
LSNEAESRKSALPQPAGASSAIPSTHLSSRPGPSDRSALDPPDEECLDYVENLQRSKQEARFTDLLFVGLFALLTLALIALAVTALFVYDRSLRSI